MRKLFKNEHKHDHQPQSIIRCNESILDHAIAQLRRDLVKANNKIAKLEQMIDPAIGDPLGSTRQALHGAALAHGASVLVRFPA